MRQQELYEMVAALLAKASKEPNTEGTCRLCPEPAKAGCRELCGQHWPQFKYARRLARQKGPAALKRFEASEIAAGNVAPPRRGRKSKDNAFMVRLNAS